MTPLINLEISIAFVSRRQNIQLFIDKYASNATSSALGEVAV